jgi:hypothetical protein
MTPTCSDCEAAFPPRGPEKKELFSELENRAYTMAAAAIRRSVPAARFIRDQITIGFVAVLSPESMKHDRGAIRRDPEDDTAAVANSAALAAALARAAEQIASLVSQQPASGRRTIASAFEAMENRFGPVRREFENGAAAVEH